MKIQLSKNRVVPDAMTVWYEHGPEVDVVMDLKRPGFAAGSVEKLYVFHVLDHLFPNEVSAAMRAWKDLLAPGGRLFLVVDDFEFLCRSVVGGDLGIAQFNADFTHPSYFTRDSLVEAVREAGIHDERIVLWFADVTGEFKKAEHELVVAAQNL